jgi:hypothetical protein
MKSLSLIIVFASVAIISCSKKDDESTGTCSDGIKNQTETGIDCGGPCAVCPSCTDGIKNQGETDIDCGGPCTACAPASFTCKINGVTWVADSAYVDTLIIPPNLSTAIYAFKGISKFYFLFYNPVTVGSAINLFYATYHKYYEDLSPSGEFADAHAGETNTITFSRYDFVNRKASADFSCTLYNISVSSVAVTQGKFTNIPIR